MIYIYNVTCPNLCSVSCHRPTLTSHSQTVPLRPCTQPSGVMPELVDGFKRQSVSLTKSDSSAVYLIHSYAHRFSRPLQTPMYQVGHDWLSSSLHVDVPKLLHHSTLHKFLTADRKVCILSGRGLFYRYFLGV